MLAPFDPLILLYPTENEKDIDKDYAIIVGSLIYTSDYKP